MPSSFRLAVLGLIASAVAAPVGASTMVVGTGLAATCSISAIRGEYSARALEVCDRALIEEALTKSDRAKTFVNRSVLRLQRNDHVGALRDADEAERLAPDIGEIYINRGVVLFMQKRYQEAVAAFDKGILLTVDEMDKAYYDRGLAHDQLYNDAAAYADFKRAAELNPEWEWPRRELTRYTVTPKRPG